MERLAGKIILLSGAGRALAAFAAGALAACRRRPSTFSRRRFIAFPVLVWLLDGAVAAPERRGLRRLAPAFRVGWLFGFGYFLVGLWWTGNALSSRPTFSPGRCHSPSSGCLRCCVLLRIRGRAGEARLERRYRTHRCARGRFRACGMVALGTLHRLSVECRRLCGDARAAAMQSACGPRRGRHECAGRLRLLIAGSAGRPRSFEARCDRSASVSSRCISAMVRCACHGPKRRTALRPSRSASSSLHPAEPEMGHGRA